MRSKGVQIVFAKGTGEGGGSILKVTILPVGTGMEWGPGQERAESKSERKVSPPKLGKKNKK